MLANDAEWLHEQMVMTRQLNELGLAAGGSQKPARTAPKR